MWQTIVNAFKDRTVRNRIFITLGLLLIFRLGCHIPLPGLNYEYIQDLVKDNELINIMSLMSGGALQYGTLFALGILPYINSFIIMQLLTIIIPPLERLSKQGDEGREKVTRITRYVALGLAVVQSIGIVVMFHNGSALDATLGQEWVTGMFIVIFLTAGSSFVMWLSERITEYGIGNGASLIIFIGILATFGDSLISAFGTVSAKAEYIWYIIGYLLLIALLFLFIVFIEGAERRIPVNYAKRVKGNKMYGGQSTYIPIKVNSGGVMPIIFASAFMMLPQLIISFLPSGNGFSTFYYQYLYPGTWYGGLVYYVVMFALIIFFSYFYAQIQFNPQEVAQNLQQYGGQIPGVRAGKPTSEYLAKRNNRITLFGAIYLGFIATIPAIFFRLLGQNVGLNNAMSATGMLIVVSVALEFNKQLEERIMMKHYKGFLSQM